MRIDAPTMAHIPALRAVWKEAFGDSEEFLDSFFTKAFSPDRSRCVFEDDQPVAMLYWFNQQCHGKPMAYLYAVATRQDRRNRGLCRALISDTHSLLTALGYAGVLLVPANRQLAASYGTMGYQIATKVTDVTCIAGAEAIQLRRIDSEEYMQLRNSLLPAGGVQLAEAHMPFLQAEADLYAGPDFVLTAAREEDSLVGVELLGNPTVGPEILRTLGARQGTFRIPGDEKNFAMYHCLDGVTPSPAYFGLAFQ